MDEGPKQGSLFEDDDLDDDLEELRGDMDTLASSGDTEDFTDIEEDKNEADDLFDDPELDPFDDLDDESDLDDEDDDGSYF